MRAAARPLVGHQATSPWRTLVTLLTHANPTCKAQTAASRFRLVRKQHRKRLGPASAFARVRGRLIAGSGADGRRAIGQARVPFADGAEPSICLLVWPLPKQVELRQCRL